MTPLRHPAPRRRTRSARLAPALLAATASLALLTSCASSDDAEKRASGPTVGAFTPGLVNLPDDDGDVVEGGTLTFGSYAEPLELDPVTTIVAGTTGGTEMAAVYDVLMRWDEDAQAVVPQLAESLTPDEDHIRWTLTLRPDVTFSDGTVLDAEAVRWSIQRYLDQGGHDAAVWSHNVEQMEVTSDLSVELTLARPWPSFDALLTTGIGMVVARSSDAGKQFTPVGAGPFVLEDRAPQERMTFAANPGVRLHPRPQRGVGLLRPGRGVDGDRPRPDRRGGGTHRQDGRIPADGRARRDRPDQLP